MYSIIIPVYKNRESLGELLGVLSALDGRLGGQLEVVFVVDASPDEAFPFLKQELPKQPFASQLLLLSRNFGSFAAIRAGMIAARGDYFAVMAADLQEPIELLEEFFESLRRESYDVVVGARRSREDPFLSRLFSAIFWRIYRLLVQEEMPIGGVDVFGCNKTVRDRLLALQESNSMLVGLLFWLGYRRKEIAYRRLPRRHGQSAWSFRRKLRYVFDSVFAFSDLPIRLLTASGLASMAFAVCFGAVVLFCKLTNLIVVPGYSATVLVISFFSGLNALGLGVIGSYVWRAFENTKGRPLAIVMESHSFKEAR